MTGEQVKNTFKKLPPKRQKVLLGFLAGHTDEKIMIDAKVPSKSALTGHFKELYKDFGIKTSYHDDERSGTRKRAKLQRLFFAHMPELFGCTPLDPDAELESLSDKLITERGVDYTKLRELLAAGKFREADKETAVVMLKAFGREEEDWLRREEIEQFPCKDLHTINRLWVKYSNGHFGFSVQKRIWQSVGGTNAYDAEAEHRFRQQVGWCHGYVQAKYSHLTFSTSAQDGHLPVSVVLWGIQGGLPGYFGIDWWFGWVLFSRLETCKV
jgi:hypothetical protein